MSTTIEVNKQSVKQFLETGKIKKFVIPEYQRPYAWTDEQIQVLFDDLAEYTATITRVLTFWEALWLMKMIITSKKSLMDSKG